MVVCLAEGYVGLVEEVAHHALAIALELLVREVRHRHSEHLGEAHRSMLREADVDGAAPNILREARRLGTHRLERLVGRRGRVIGAHVARLVEDLVPVHRPRPLDRVRPGQRDDHDGHRRRGGVQRRLPGLDGILAEHAAIEREAQQRQRAVVADRYLRAASTRDQAGHELLAAHARIRLVLERPEALLVHQLCEPVRANVPTLDHQQQHVRR
mmetsp:Transcript_11179/g.28014  ORF Transcript_11179/g.28014 Transcript_11179/m.28014 type:complete len:213 (-) Transcript_11179:60-698(-)